MECASLPASQLSGNPPRTHKFSIASLPEPPISSASSGVNCRKAILTRETFGRLPQALHRGRAENQKLRRFLPGPPSLINHSAQNLKNFGHALDFIHDHELPGVRFKIKIRLGELGPIPGSLQIEIDRRTGAGNFQRQGCLADLPRSKKAHSRMLLQEGNQVFVPPGGSSLQI